MSQIATIVGRCHVGERNTEVLRYVRSRIKRSAWRKLDRKTRRAVIREVVDTHRANRDTYLWVQRGCSAALEVPRE